jgi:predicted RNA-binding Zn-ribbon protein involved in translation (DUF1610 family)
MEDRPNFYMLLGLDPSVDDAALIATAVQDKRRSWSAEQSMGNPAAAGQARSNLARLAEIQRVMNDPESRRQEADDARKRIRQERKSSLQQLDRVISLLRIPGICTSDDIAKLVKQLGGRLEEREIRERIRTAGIDVESAGRPAKNTAAKPVLDASQMDQIRPKLKLLGAKDLYGFLELDRNASARSLYEQANRRNKELLQIGKNDAETNTAKALCGHCMAIFGSDADKQKYDNALAVEAMDGMRPLIELAGGSGNFLSIEQQDELIRQARAQGVAAVDARAFIEQLAARRKWTLQRSGKKQLPSEQLRQCGHCWALAEKGVSHCSSCGEPLDIRCPRCSKLVPTEHIACEHCGFRIGDWSWIKAELDRTDRLIGEFKIDAATQQLKELLHNWPEWRIVRDRLDEAGRLTKQRQHEHARLDELVRDSRYLAAGAEAERFRGKWPEGNIDSLITSIAKKVRQAQSAFDEGERQRREGRMSDAVVNFHEAQRICADFDAARRAMASLPPLSPSSLVVKPQGDGFQLRWTAEDRMVDGYRLVRKAHAAPSGPDDGAFGQSFTDVACTDPVVKEGVPWHYAVFSQRGGVFSASAARSGPHLRLAPIRDLVARAGDGEIQLTWSLPNGAVGAEIWRRQGDPPDRPGSGTRLTASRDSFHDSGLANDIRVGYLVIPAFEDPHKPGARLLGPGRTCFAEPTAPPVAVTDLAFTRETGGIRLSWTPPPSPGQVQIRQSQTLPALQVGAILAKEQADALGVSVLATAPGTASVPLPGMIDTWFVPLTVKGTLAVVGKPINVALIAGPSELTADHNERDIRLRWRWPDGCRHIAVCFGYDDYPETPDAGGAIRQDITLDRYNRERMFVLPGVERRPHHFSLFAVSDDGRRYSRPLKRLVQMGQSREVQYRIAAPRSLFSRLATRRSRELEVRGFGRLPATVLVAKARVVPTSPDDGEKLMFIPEMTLAGTSRIPIPPSPSNTGNVAKLFFTDASHLDEVRLVSGPLHELKL